MDMDVGAGGCWRTEVFECRQKYKVPVRMCTDTEVNDYIVDVLSAAYKWIKVSAVDKVGCARPMVT